MFFNNEVARIVKGPKHLDRDLRRQQANAICVQQVCVFLFLPFVEEHALPLTLVVCVLDDEGHGVGEGPGLLIKFGCSSYRAAWNCGRVSFG